MRELYRNCRSGKRKKKETNRPKPVRQAERNELKKKDKIES